MPASASSLANFNKVWNVDIVDFSIFGSYWLYNFENPERNLNWEIIADIETKSLYYGTCGQH
jgi:hypothetical protein